MLQVLRPSYTFKITITGDALHGGEWNALERKSGCDETWAKLQKALADAGLHGEVFLEKFEHC